MQQLMYLLKKLLLPGAYDKKGRRAFNIKYSMVHAVFIVLTSMT